MKFKNSILLILTAVMADYSFGQNPLNESYKGVPDGRHVSHYPNGNIQGDMTIKNGKLTGKYLVYFDNGQIETYDEFENGMFHGYNYQFDKNGDTLKMEIHRHDTLLFNADYYYYSKGKIKSIAIDKFYSDSNLIINPFVKSKIRIKEVTYDSRQLYSKSNYDLILEYYENGNIKGIYEGKADNYNGKYLEFHEDGKPKVVAYNINGKWDGDYIEYYSNGSIKIKGFFKDDNFEGEYLEFHDNGKEKVVAFCIKGKYHGEYKEFDKTGKLIRTTMYDNGKKQK